MKCYSSFYFSLDGEFLVEVWALSQPRSPPMAIQARFSGQLSILWTIILSLKLQPIILSLQQQPSVTLYPNSVVVNLHDGNTSSLYNSQTLWLVQFYSHWSVIISPKCHNLNALRCGHCQRFAPFWQALAEDIKGRFFCNVELNWFDCILGWQPHVRVAAINCAEQSCDRYQVLMV